MQKHARQVQFCFVSIGNEINFAKPAHSTYSLYLAIFVDMYMYIYKKNFLDGTYLASCCTSGSELQPKMARTPTRKICVYIV